MKKILVTGAAGFIGSKVSQLLMKDNLVIGVDEINDYYDIRLKQWRLKKLQENNNFIFFQKDISDYNEMKIIFKKYKIDIVINLAARAGVRYSFIEPLLYFKSNVTGNIVLLELSSKFNVEKFILSSSSSVYAGQEMPFDENKIVDYPISPYAASKRSAELSSYSYHNAYGLDITVFRYFTVYGPASRPDMAIYRFIKWINDGTPLLLFGDGNQIRSFTYIDDIASGTVEAITHKSGFEIINLGNDKTNSIIEVIRYIEKYTGKKAIINNNPSHKGDMKGTWANIEKAKNILNWQPKINLETGLKKTVEWTTDNLEFINKISIDTNI